VLTETTFLTICVPLSLKKNEQAVHVRPSSFIDGDRRR